MGRVYETQQTCPVARSLDLLGDRWTLLVVRDLLRGHTKFTELMESLAGISPNLLSARLKSLEDARVVVRSFYSEHPPRAEYALTDKGRALGSVIRAIYQWGEEFEPRTAGAAPSR
ncbi:MAG: helix-turn-helix domain-containing protein [Dehalococcoidia bacterium]